MLIRNDYSSVQAFSSLYLWNLRNAEMEKLADHYLNDQRIITSPAEDSFIVINWGYCRHAASGFCPYELKKMKRLLIASYRWQGNERGRRMQQ